MKLHALKRSLVLIRQGAFSIVFKVELLNLSRNTFDVIWQEMNIVDDEVWRCCVTRHELRKNFISSIIEKDIVARSAFVELIHCIMHGSLNKVR